MYFMLNTIITWFMLYISWVPICCPEQKNKSEICFRNLYIVVSLFIVIHVIFVVEPD